MCYWLRDINLSSNANSLKSIQKNYNIAWGNKAYSLITKTHALINDV